MVDEKHEATAYENLSPSETAKLFYDIMQRLISFNEEMNDLKATIQESIKLLKSGHKKDAINVLEKGTMPFWGSKKVMEFTDTTSQK